MTTNIDAPKALALLQEAVAERGADFVYAPKRIDKDSPSCRYWHAEESAPGCVVGLALAKAGVTTDVLATLDGKGSAERLHLHDLGAVMVTPKGARVFAEAQFAQDGGESWGAALKAARVVAASELEAA